MSTLKRTREGQSDGFTFSVEVFLRVWEHLETMCQEKERFALRWLLQDEARLRLFIGSIAKLDVSKFLKGLLCNGFRNCKTLDPPVLSGEDWAKVGKVFGDNSSFVCLPQPLKKHIRSLSTSNLQGLLAARITDWKIEVRQGTTFSHVVQLVTRIDPAVLAKCKHCFLGKWDESVLRRFDPTVHHIFRPFPKEYVVMRKTHNYVSFYDVSGKEAVLVAVHVSRGHNMSKKAKAFIRMLLEELFDAHRKIVRASSASFDSEMVGHGPLHNCYKAGKDIVSFYTSVLKVKDMVKSCESPAAFQDLIDRHAATELMEIVLGLYLWWCPMLLKQFFDYSAPYMKYPQCTEIDLEQQLQMKGPPAYQLYITKDYCSEMHADGDATDFTLCYVSHPDEAISPVDFVIGEYSFRMPIGDCDLFAFRSDSPHATGYRPATQNAAYIGCVAVNNRLHNLMRRRSTT